MKKTRKGRKVKGEREKMRRKVERGREERVGA